MPKNSFLILLLGLVLIGPLLLRPKAESVKANRTLVIVTPHNEATRHEFGRAFVEYWFAKTGERVRIDWRTPGGTSEIARYLASEYLAAFQNEWTNKLNHPWSAAVEAAFDNPKAPSDDAVRKAFLESNVSCGIDLFFGGGSFDFSQQAAAGRLVDCGFIKAHPELFNDRAIPQTLGGESYWDPQGRWIGAALGAFGICYNTDALARLKIEKPPMQWSDLTNPKFFGTVALADPTQSGSVAKAFEMLIQQQMLMEVAKRKATNGEDRVRGLYDSGDIVNLRIFDNGKTSPEEEKETLRSGWSHAMNLIQKISANARYFADGATKIPFDVESSDAAAGMCIDFYGRFQSEAVRKPDGSSRMQYVTPVGGSSVGADPIGMLRGAPHPELARAFIEFVLSLDGQKLWNFKVGAPGGPEKYALRRLPIRREIYSPEFAQFRSDPEVDPYAQANAFVYHDKWTAPLFRTISFIVRAMCIDPHDELRETWRELIAAGFPPEATAVFEDVSKVSYEAASGPIGKVLRSPQKIDQVRLAKELSDSFRAQYRHAAELARAGK